MSQGGTHTHDSCRTPHNRCGWTIFVAAQSTRWRRGAAVRGRLRHALTLKVATTPHAECSRAKRATLLQAAVAARTEGLISRCQYIY